MTGHINLFCHIFCKNHMYGTGGAKFMMDMTELKNMDPRTVDRSTLVQRNMVQIDANATKEERLGEYIK